MISVLAVALPVSLGLASVASAQFGRNSLERISRVPTALTDSSTTAAPSFGRTRAATAAAGSPTIRWPTSTCRSVCPS